MATAVDEAVKYGLVNRDLSGITLIDVDEISRKRGHVYVTNVYDLGSRRLLWSGEGRGQKTLQAFFEAFGRSGLRNWQVFAVICGTLRRRHQRQGATSPVGV